MAMRSALCVDETQTLNTYLEFHRTWQARLDHEIQRLRAIDAIAVVSNVGYLPLAAAQQLGLANYALSSLNWADLLSHYCGGIADLTPIIRLAGDIYANADAFLQPAPSMPAPNFDNCRAIGSIAQLGQSQHDTLCTRLGIDRGMRIGVISAGGMHLAMSFEKWPRQENWAWVVPDDAEFDAPNFYRHSQTGVCFLDTLASSDLFICKPGYGSFTEAAINAIPVLYLSRDGWPEESYLVDWLRIHGRCIEISRDAFDHGNIADAVTMVSRQPAKLPISNSGVDDVLRILSPVLQIQSPARSIVR
jgi:hypothetical protein